jgi:DNA-binding transcriptional regulator YiaG
MSKTYRYTESGLDNVTIHNMDVVVDDAGEEVYAIPNILGLHKVIAHCIVAAETGMTPKELRFLRTEMGLTQGELAQVVKKDHQTVGRWERGETPLDGNAEVVIRMLAAERLGIDPKLEVEELAERCIPSAEFRRIDIDGSNPKRYRPLAA